MKSHSGHVIRAAVKGGHDEQGEDVYICRVMVTYQRSNAPFPVTVRYSGTMKSREWSSLILSISSIGIMHPGDKVCYFSNANQTIVAVRNYDLLIAKPSSYTEDFDDKGK